MPRMGWSIRSNLVYRYARRAALGRQPTESQPGGRRCCDVWIWLAFVAALALLSPASAQDYPSRSVRIIVPFGAGGPADVYARVIGQHLQEALKQSFVVENRPGAGAIIGTDEVAKAAPDGYTLLMMSNTHTVNETLLPEPAVSS